MGLFSLFKKSQKSPDLPRLEPSQEWHYHTRDAEEMSTLKILKIENEEGHGRIVHIAISGLKIKNPNHPTGFTDEILHLPVTEEFVCNSITTLVQVNGALPDYASGYEQWKSAFEAKKAGVFKMPIAEIVLFIEKTLTP